VLIQHGPVDGAVLGAPGVPANVEHVAKVRAERHAQGDGDRERVVVENADALVQSCMQEAIPSNAQGARPYVVPVRRLKCQIGELQRHHEVVLAGGGQELGQPSVQAQLQQAQEARVVPVQAVTVGVVGGNVPIAVADEEHLVLFEHDAVEHDPGLQAKLEATR
jgi:hypothetical protein